jgi:TolA-binding protein
MDAVTYPHPQVVAELTETFVPCKLESGKQPELARAMGVRWLPGTVVVDRTQRAAHAIVGFLSPPDYLVELAFGRAIAEMAAKRYEQAHALFRQVAETEGAERAPDAYFWWGISRFRQSKDFASAVREQWGQIVRRWPNSQAARKVSYAFAPPAETGAWPVQPDGRPPGLA